MSSPPRPLPQVRDYPKYYEDVPSSGDRPPSREDLDNYFDHSLPAPHRLSGSYLSPSASPRTSTEDIHARSSSTSHPAAHGGAGPRYLSPLAANSATDTEGIGLQHSNSSQISMIGLGSTPGLQRKSTWLQREQTRERKSRRLVCSFCLSS